MPVRSCSEPPLLRWLTRAMVLRWSMRVVAETPRPTGEQLVVRDATKLKMEFSRAFLVSGTPEAAGGFHLVSSWL